MLHWTNASSDAIILLAQSPRGERYREPVRSAVPATIGGLDTYDFHVSPNVIVETVVANLQLHPELPGVIIATPEQFIGLVSRSKCLELLSRPYGNALFLKRSIFTLYDELAFAPIVLPAATRIDQAVNIALARPLEQRYEPLVVDFGAGSLRLLDLHRLLLAQSQLLENANRLTQRQVEIERALSSTLELDAVLHLILRQIADMVPYDRAGILLEHGGVLQFAARYGFPDSEGVRQFRVSSAQSAIYQRLCEERRPLTFADVSERVDWETVPGLPSARSWLGLPLIHAQGVLGMLSLTRTTIHTFDEEEIRLAQSFTGQAAVALQNARLYEEIKAFNQVLEGRVQERTQALQSAYDKLAQLDRAKLDFITVTSHELRTPLTVVNCYAQMLQANLGTHKSNLAEMAEGLHKGIQRMHDIINTMLSVAKIDQETVPLFYSAVSFHWLVNALREKLAEVLQARRLTLHLQDLEMLPVIQADTEALHKVFHQLLINAIKYTPDGGAITVSGQAVAAEASSLGEASVQITVSDTGIGIDPAYHELIFTKFYRIGDAALHSSSQTSFKGGGPGLGLSLAQGLVHAHRGKIWAESPGYDEATLPGSQFHVLLPVATAQ